MAAYFTTSVSGIECERLPDLPVIVIVWVPELACFGTLIVRTDEPPPDTVAGFSDAETPFGVPLTLRETVPLKPWSDDTKIVFLPVPPRAICSVVCDALSAKFPAEVTTRVALAE